MRLHLVMLELTLGAFKFFKQCPSAALSKTTTEESMEIENYFLIAPKSHRCEVSLYIILRHVCSCEKEENPSRG